MNIFVLDPDPAIAASYHCDQHLHKMILEAGQMLSTAMHNWWPDSSPHIYKPAYVNHPCTQWVCADKSNAAWVAALMHSLNEIRLGLGSEDHSSLEISKVFQDWLDVPVHSDLRFIFCGDPFISSYQWLTVPQRYQRYYQQKSVQWHLTGKGHMSYKGRSIPPFMTEILAR